MLKQKLNKYYEGTSYCDSFPHFQRQKISQFFADYVTVCWRKISPKLQIGEINIDFHIYIWKVDLKYSIPKRSNLLPQKKKKKKKKSCVASNLYNNFVTLYAAD